MANNLLEFDNKVIEFSGLPEEARKLYFLYEYSDDILFRDGGIQYPSIGNYVETCLLTEEEMMQALMYK